MNAYHSLPDNFSQSEHYRSFLRCGPPQVSEPEPATEHISERHVHCIWYDPAHRPSRLTSNRGETVEILNPGSWNHESGPDFRNAEWSVDGRRFQGDVEIHLRPMDWKHHRHEHDPRYQQVLLHVTYYPGELPPEILPHGCTQVSLKKELDQLSHSPLEQIALSAYPWDSEGSAGGVRTWFASHSEEEGRQMLIAAGQERLRRKTVRMARRIHAMGEAEALYVHLMRGLGYKQNANQTEALARSLSLSCLRSLSRCEPERGYALLTGCAGLLPTDCTTHPFPDWFSVRSLWDIWWKQQDSVSDTGRTINEWNLDHCRPGNQPARRLWAAASWFCSRKLPEHEWKPSPGEAPGVWTARVMHALQVPPPEHTGDDVRIVGRQRAVSLMMNAVIPWRICVCPEPASDGMWSGLPAEPMNSTGKKAALRFLGKDAHPRMYRGAVERQGLLQLAEDFGI